VVGGSIAVNSTLLARTQTAPSPAAISPPGPGTPTSMVATTWFLFGSILETVPSDWFSTQTPAAPAARNRGWQPTAIVAATVFDFGSIRWTDPLPVERGSPVFVTQAAP